MSGNKLYGRYDLLDEGYEVQKETLTEMKKWLVDFWCVNPSEDMTVEDHEYMIEKIWRSDEKELFDRMLGVGYAFEECE